MRQSLPVVSPDARGQSRPSPPVTQRVRRTEKRIGELVTVEVSITEGGAPDWPTRQRAAEFMADVAGVRTRDQDERDAAGRPVSVSIVLSGDSRDALPTETVSISLGGPAIPPVVIDALPGEYDAGGNEEVREKTGECR